MNEGGAIEEGDVLCEVETDKAVVAFEAVGFEGYLAKIIAPDGTKDIKVGENVCIVVENEEDVAAFKNWKIPPDGAVKILLSLFFKAIISLIFDLTLLIETDFIKILQDSFAFGVFLLGSGALTATPNGLIIIP